MEFVFDLILLTITEGQSVDLTIALSFPASYGVTVFARTEDGIATGNTLKT